MSKGSDAAVAVARQRITVCSGRPSTRGPHERLDDHQVHERAWVTVLAGEVEIASSAGQRVVGGPGLVVEFAPNERHAVHARTDTRLLLLLTPWPGIGHAGALTLQQKSTVRTDAAEHRSASPNRLPTI